MKFALLLTIAILFFAAPVVNAQKIKVDVDETVDFKTYKTFGWADGQIARNPAVSQVIVTAIENELKARGLVKSESEPDLEIAAVAAALQDVQGIGPTWNSQRYKSWGGYGNPSSMITVSKGTLLIDLLDKRNNDFSVFRGVAKDAVLRPTTGDPVEDAKNVEKIAKKAIKRIFKKYPIKSKN
jgi:hypothetical protein